MIYKHYQKCGKRERAIKITILAASAALIYLIISLYFINHLPFNTYVNGVKVSLKSHRSALDAIKKYTMQYELVLTEINGDIEVIKGRDIGMSYNEAVDEAGIKRIRSTYRWIISLFMQKQYHIDSLFTYDRDRLAERIQRLNCMKRELIKPRNVSFKFINGSYHMVDEIYGNSIIKENLFHAIDDAVMRGDKRLNLIDAGCYETPRYTVNSDKAHKTMELLNKCLLSRITYRFGKRREVLDAGTINKWLTVDSDLDVAVNEKSVLAYINRLCNRYDTVGAARSFRTSTGKEITVGGGIYGWKIDREAEGTALAEDIMKGLEVVKEPIYEQRAVSREEDDIGDTYVEINITRQHVWFYKNSRLIIHGPVVTGNPNRGYATVTGTHMINYKQMNAVLRGPGYEAKVIYWMPFYGNMGLHDASWRSSFGGEIYKSRGTHGCVNAPFYLAEAIYKNIDEGTPVICYEEP